MRTNLEKTKRRLKSIGYKVGTSTLASFVRSALTFALISEAIAILQHCCVITILFFVLFYMLIPWIVPTTCFYCCI